MHAAELVKITPSERQLAYQSLGFYAFIHFSVNTFTDKEWGDGTEPESIFNPSGLDAEQWVSAVRDAGMKGLILTCKHHDGFCLWQTDTTEHCVRNSPYRNGRGDVVKEVSDACKKYGIRFGVYLSPWDRNAPVYGCGETYDDFYVAQLTELLTRYGDVFSVWLDGACGEGPNGKKQRYDWNRYYEVIRKLQPGACIAVSGPDIRWCGNEAGKTRTSEWSVVPARLADQDRIAGESQHTEADAGRLRELRWNTLDLGSREAVADEPEMIWYPAEVDTSIRPGWFYHEKDDSRVRPLDELLRIYYSSVGGNAMLLLNIPPDRRGLFHENDVRRLQEIGAYLKKTFAVNLAETAAFQSDSDDGVHLIENVRHDGSLTLDSEDYFKTADGTETATIDIRFGKPVAVSHVVLKENIAKSQRVEEFYIDAFAAGKASEIYAGTVIGYQKIAHFTPVVTDRVRIRITKSRISPTLAFIGVYR